MSGVTCHKVDKVVELVGGGFVINGASQSSWLITGFGRGADPIRIGVQIGIRGKW